MTDEEIKLECKRLEINKSVDELVLTIAKLQKENADLKEFYYKELKDEENAMKRIVELTKGNEQLKYNLKCRDDELAEHKAQIEQLKQQAESDQLALNESKEIIAEQKAHCKAVDEVNEKMKCCENCKHSYTDSENNVFCYLPILQEECKSCRIYNHKEIDNDYWELAE